MKNKTVYSALDDWLAVIEKAKSRNTLKTYAAAAAAFRVSLSEITAGRNKPLESLSESDYESFLNYLKKLHPQSEKLYATILVLFFEYLSAKNIHKINMDAIRYMRRNETRKVGKRLRKLDMNALQAISESVIRLKPGKDAKLARAKTFVIWLCRSGLRATEATRIRLVDLDAKRGRGTVIGKGDKEAHFILDDDMLEAMREYHAIRKIQSDWVFISHSRRNAKTHSPITYATARRDVMTIYHLLLEQEPEFPITPHQFRHLFVTQVYRQTGDIKEAQSAARHDNIMTTDRYIHDDDALSRIASRMKKARGK